MEKIKFFCLEKKYEPKRANSDDAGLDLFARINEKKFVFKDWNLEYKKRNTLELEQLQDKEIIIYNNKISLYPNQRIAIPLGIKTEIPVGYYADLRPRSGNSLKLGLLFVNSIGLIDAGYRDEWCAIIQNISNNIISISDGMKIAQVVFKKLEDINYNIELVENEKELDNSNNRNGGLGSTDKI